MQIDEMHDGYGLQIEDISVGNICINGKSYSEPICITDTVVLPVNKNTPECLQAEDFNQALSCKPQLILIGTGSELVFIHPRLWSLLANEGIGVESMSTAAACRTYMLLRSEGRNVWAWLWPITA